MNIRGQIKAIVDRSDFGSIRRLVELVNDDLTSSGRPLVATFEGEDYFKVEITGKNGREFFAAFPITTPAEAVITAFSVAATEYEKGKKDALLRISEMITRTRI